VVPLRPLVVADVLEATVATLRRYPAATLGSSALLVGAVTAAQVVAMLPVLQALRNLPPAPADAAGVQRWLEAWTDFPWQAALVGGALAGLLSFALLAMLSGVMAVVAGQAVLGRPLRLAQAWAAVGPRLAALLLTALLVAVATAGPSVVLLALWAVVVTAGLPGVLVALLVVATLAAAPLTLLIGVRLCLATPAVMLESDAGRPIGPLRAVRRSWLLVRGAWWRTFGVVLLGGVIAAAVGQVVSLPVQVVAGALPLSVAAALAVGLLGSAVGQAITLPIVGLVLALVYVDRRIRTEGLDAALARAVGLPPP
jgi:hypothetical protein